MQASEVVNDGTTSTVIVATSAAATSSAASASSDGGAGTQTSTALETVTGDNSATQTAYVQLEPFGPE